MKRKIVIHITLIIISLALAGCASTSMPTIFKPSSGQKGHPTSLSSLNNAAFWQGNPNTIWYRLQHTSTGKLADLQNQTSHPNTSAWIQLALISKRYSTNTQQLVRELLAWREHYPTHLGNQLFPDNNTLNQLLASSPPQHIAILLPLRGSYGSSGQAVRSGLLNAYYAYLSSVGSQIVSFYDTAQGQNITAVYQQALSQGADFVIGPLVKENVQQLSKQGNFTAPTLALNYTDIYFGSLPTHFYEFGLLPEDEANQVADRAFQDGRTRAIVIAPSNPWGKRVTSTLTARWQSLGGSIQDAWYYSSPATFNTDIARLLHVNPQLDKQLMQDENNKDTLAQQRRRDLDVIFLFSKPQEARVIVPLLRYYYASDIPVYASSSVYSGRSNPTKDVDLDGVTICDIPWSVQLARNPAKANDEDQSSRLYAVGKDAYMLSHELPRLAQLPNFPIYGATGALTMSSQQQIHRRVPCSTVRNGRLY